MDEKRVTIISDNLRFYADFSSQAAIPVYEELYNVLWDVPHATHTLSSIERLLSVARLGVQLLPGWAVTHSRLGQTLLLRVDKVPLVHVSRRALTLCTAEFAC